LRRTIRCLLTAAVAAALLFALFCTINDDNGNPVNPGIPPGGNGTIVGPPGGNPGANPGDSTGGNTGGGTVTLVPVILADNGYVGIGDTMSILITLLSDTARGAAVISGGSIKITTTRPDDWIRPGSVVTTDTNGRAIVRFSSVTEGTAGIKLTYGATAERNISIEVTDDPPRNITMSASPSRLPADGSSKSVITVQVKNNDNNPIVGDIVTFSTNLGLVTAQSTTDADGKATATLTSEQRNAIATVTATLKSDGGREVKATVEFYGVSVSATVDPENIKPNDTASATVKAILLDGAQTPIVGEKITFIKKNPETRFVGVDTTKKTVTMTDSSLTMTTDNSGRAQCVITSLASGTERIYVRSVGAEGYADITYTGQTVTVDWDDPENPTPGIGGMSSIAIKYFERNGTTPVNNAKLKVTVTMGALDEFSEPVVIFAQELTMTADNRGRKTFSFQNPSFTGTATVYVKATDAKTGESATGKMDITFKAMTASRIEIVATPDVIATNGGQATLKATVYDDDGNRVDDEVISFNVVEGPGGGEYLSPPTAVTGKSGEMGVATSYLVAGSIPSFFKTVQVVASTYAIPPNKPVTSEPVFLTIAGPPKHITVRSNIDNVSAGTATYGLKIVALVSDINNNPVPDNWEVTFSSKIVGYTYWMRGNPRIENDKCTMDTIPVDADGERFTAKKETEYKPFPEGTFNDVNWSRFPEETVVICNEDIKKPDDPLIITVSERRTNTPADYFGQYEIRSSGGYNKIYPIGTPTYDLNLGRGGVLDPSASTTVILARTAKTKNGIAENEIIYGQSDAGKVRLMLWAECKGLVTSNAESIRLPRAEGAKNWDPLK